MSIREAVQSAHTGSITAITHWLQYADHQVAPLRRSVTMPLREFRGLADLNAQARQWVMQTAGLSTHGTTRQAPLTLFAAEQPLLNTDLLALLFSDELARRERRKFISRLRRAQFRTTKTLDQFDFERLPNLNRALVHDLVTGRKSGVDEPIADSCFVMLDTTCCASSTCSLPD